MGLESVRCPECGRGFDPHDPGTMNVGRPLGAFGRWVLGPFPWVAGALVALPALFACYVATNPQCYYVPIYLLVPVVAAVATEVAFLAISGVRTSVAESCRQPSPQPMMRDRRARGLAIALAVLLVSVYLHLPLYASFWVSKPWLERVASQYVNDPTVPAMYSGGGPGGKAFVPRQAGLYRVVGVSRINGGVLLQLDSSDTGFAYLPQGGSVRGHYNTGADGYLGANWWWMTGD